MIPEGDFCGFEDDATYGGKMRLPRNSTVMCETPAMLYSESEKAWLDRRAEKIAEERGWPLKKQTA